MGHRLRQNATNVSEIYIGRPIYISDVQYRYPTSNIYIRHPISISDIRVPISVVRYLYRTFDIQYPTSARARARTKARARVGISDVGYRYQTSDIYIGRPI